MNEQELKWNQLIAEYTGYRFGGDIIKKPIDLRCGRFLYGWNVHQLQYHKSYDWLMPVVQKILGQGHVLKLLPYVEQIRVDLAKADLAKVYKAVCVFLKESKKLGV